MLTSSRPSMDSQVPSLTHTTNSHTRSETGQSQTLTNVSTSTTLQDRPNSLSSDSSGSASLVSAQSRPASPEADVYGGNATPTHWGQPAGSVPDLSANSSSGQRRGMRMSLPAPTRTENHANGANSVNIITPVHTPNQVRRMTHQGYTNPSTPDLSSPSFDVQQHRLSRSFTDLSAALPNGLESNTVIPPSSNQSTSTTTTIISQTTPTSKKALKFITKPTGGASSPPAQPHPLSKVFTAPTSNPAPTSTHTSSRLVRPAHNRSQSGHETRTPSVRARGPVPLSPLPPGIKLNPLNYTSIYRKSVPPKRTFFFSPFSRSNTAKNAAIRGTFTVNPFLYIPPELLPDLGPDEDERDRKNLKLEVEGGGIDVDIWLLGQLPSSLYPPPPQAPAPIPPQVSPTPSQTQVPQAPSVSTTPSGGGGSGGDGGNGQPNQSHAPAWPSAPRPTGRVIPALMGAAGPDTAVQAGQTSEGTIEENAYILQHQQQPTPQFMAWALSIRTNLYLGISGESNNPFPLIARIHTPAPNRPPFHLMLKSGSGPVSLHLPRSFHGMLIITITSGDPNSHIVLSRDMENSAVILSESSTSRTYFLGDMRKLSGHARAVSMSAAYAGGGGGGHSKSISYHGHGHGGDRHGDRYGTNTNLKESGLKRKSRSGINAEIDRVQITVNDAKIALHWEGEKALVDVKWRKVRKG
ncbi:hypothetical protein D9758_010339 [Tetrapyrgos nigripes]|uniref:DUF7330 domain-containing protein n=1 Tax=Tetrapyrgos nigripes TaxID=182062 RepID=A0A8H5CZB3_9AGAR|nr:hypothetical protein D9758_010339 [Tetrapyrgos nigripes]